MKRLASRVSPATVIASIALFVSLGGVSYGVATGSIDSRELKNNNVRSGDLRNNDVRTRDLRNNDVRSGDVRNSTLTGGDVGADKLTGADILESSLGKVPSATSADSATTANSAGNVGGFEVRRIDFFKQPVSTAATEVLNFNGLRLVAACDAGGDLSVVATNTAATTAQIHAGQTQTGVANESEDDDFATNDTLEIAALSDTNATGILAYARSGGPAVTVTYLMEETGGCSFLGTATGG